MPFQPDAVDVSIDPEAQQKYKDLFTPKLPQLLTQGLTLPDFVSKALQTVGNFGAGLKQGVSAFEAGLPGPLQAVGGFATEQLQRGPLGTALGSNPDLEQLRALPEGPDKQRALDAFWEDYSRQAALGVTGGFGITRKVGPEVAQGLEKLTQAEIFDRIARGQPAAKVPVRGVEAGAPLTAAEAAAKPGAAANEALATAQGKAFAPGTGAALEPAAGTRAALYDAVRRQDWEAAQQHIQTLQENGETIENIADSLRRRGLLMQVQSEMEIAAGARRAKEALAAKDTEALGEKIASGPVAGVEDGFPVSPGQAEQTFGAVQDMLATQQALLGPEQLGLRAAEATPESVRQLFLERLARGGKAGSAESVAAARAIQTGIDVRFKPLGEFAQNASAEVQKAADLDRFASQESRLGGVDQGGGRGPVQTALGGDFGGPPDAPRWTLGGVAGAPQTALASLDLSAVLRQALPFVAYPVTFVRGMGKALSGYVTAADKFAAQQARLKLRVLANGGNELYLADMNKGIVGGEERYASSLVSKIPFFGKWVDRSQQSYIGMLNEVRAGVFNGIVEGRRAAGNPMTKTELDDLANTLNHFSGRGYKIGGAVNLPGGGQVMSAESAVGFSRAANVLLFSPQFFVSRIRMATDSIGALNRARAAVQAGRPIGENDIASLRLMTGYIAAVGGLYGLAKAAGLNVNTDMLSGTFGKIDLGPPAPEKGITAGALSALGISVQTYNGHVYADPSAGEVQLLRFLARAKAGGEITSRGDFEAFNTGKFGAPTYWDLVQNFYATKAAPLPGLVINVLKGSDLGGNKISLSDLWSPDIMKNAMSLFIPLAAQDAIQASGLGYPGQEPPAPSFTPQVQAQLATLTIPGGLDAQGRPTPATHFNAAIGRPSGTIQMSDNESAAYQRLAYDSLNISLQDLFSGSSTHNGKGYAQMSEPERVAAVNALKAMAESEAKVKVADSIVQSAATTDDRTRGVLLGLSASAQLAHRADWLAHVAAIGALPQDVRAAVDSARKMPPTGLPEPTVAEYLTNQPLIHGYATIPPYTIGNKREWAALAEANKRLSAQEESVRQSGARGLPQTIRILALRSMSPQDRALLARYSSSLVVNRKRALYLVQHPSVRRFISSLAPE